MCFGDVVDGVYCFGLLGLVEGICRRFRGAPPCCGFKFASSVFAAAATAAASATDAASAAASIFAAVCDATAVAVYVSVVVAASASAANDVASASASATKAATSASSYVVRCVSASTVVAAASTFASAA